MKRQTAMQKAEMLYKNENVFKVSDTPNHEYWVVKGKQKVSYDVLYHIAKDVYTCTCKNIRLSDCSHILAVKMEKGEINGTEISYKKNNLELVI